MQTLPERPISTCQTLRPDVAPVGAPRTAPTRLRRAFYWPDKAAIAEVEAPADTDVL